MVDTQLSGLEVVEEKAFRQPDGTYRYHVCMQLDKDNLSKAMSKALDKDVNTRLKGIFRRDDTAVKDVLYNGNVCFQFTL